MKEGITKLNYLRDDDCLSYVCPCFLCTQNHQSFVAVIENEKVGAPVLEMWEVMEGLWQNVVLCWRGCFGTGIHSRLVFVWSETALSESEQLGTHSGAVTRKTNLELAEKHLCTCR